MGKDGRLYVRLDEKQKARWERAAKKAGYVIYGEPNLSAFVRAAVDAVIEASKIS